MCRSENTNRDLASVRNEELLLLHDRAVRPDPLVDAVGERVVALLEDLRVLVVVSHVEGHWLL